MPNFSSSEPTKYSDQSSAEMHNGVREFICASVILALVATCVFAPWLFCGKAFYWGDIGLFFLPLANFLKANLALGKVPLWNPYLFCGAPYVGNPQVSLLYPSTLVLSIFPAPLAIMISEVAHIFAGGLFFWLFARRGSFKLDFIPAILAAITYMLCGYFVAKAQFPNMLAALAYVPLLLYQTELLVLFPSLRQAVIFAAILALELLAGHLQIAVLALYLMIPYGFLVYRTQRPQENLFKLVGTAFAGGVFGAMLACGYLLPVIELLRSSARQELTLKIANRFYLPIYELSNFLLPNRFGSPMNGNWHAHGNYWETDNYIGFVGVLLALCFVGMVAIKWRTVPFSGNQICFWIIVLILNTWLALGTYGKFYTLAFHMLPALSSFHDPARFMLGANISLALFAGCGFQVILTKLPNNWRWPVTFLLLVISVVNLGHHDQTLYPLKPISTIQSMSNAVVPSILRQREAESGDGRVLMPDSSRAWQSFTTYKTFEANDPSFMREWPDTLSPCLGMTDGLREVGGYDPEYRKDSQELAALAQYPVAPPVGKSGDVRPIIPHNYARYLASVGVQYLVTYRLGNVTAEGLREIYRTPWKRRGRQVSVYQNLYFNGRAHLFERWKGAPGENVDLELLSYKIISADSTMFNEPIIDNLATQSSPRNGPPVPVPLTKDDPDDVKLMVPGGPVPSVLVLADSEHPGWTATIDGHRTNIYKANLDQRSISIPATSVPLLHTVEFRYLPIDFLVGFYISLVSLVVFFGVIVGFRTAPNPLKS